MKEPLHARSVELLEGWRAPSIDQEALRHAYLALLAARDDACWRSCVPGHLTASAVVLDESGTSTCLVHHGLVKAWLAPGGHLEPGDDSLAAAALREATEETGLPGLVVDPVPLQLNVHPITCRGSGPTRHLDVRFLAVGKHVQPAVSDESTDVRWWAFDHLPPDLYPEVRELLLAARARLDHLPTAKDH